MDCGLGLPVGACSLFVALKLSGALFIPRFLGILEGASIIAFVVDLFCSTASSKGRVLGCHKLEAPPLLSEARAFLQDSLRTKCTL